jgi:tRNA(Arg) A34 adenosine deaminase TadA
VYYPKGASPSRGFKDRYSYETDLDERVNNLSKRDKRWLAVASRIAMESRERTRHGCIIVNGGAVQSKGTNTYRNQPGIIEDTNALSVHAEINALKRSGNVSGAVAYISRVNNLGEPRQSRPCPECLKALKDAGVKRIIYTVNGEEYL